MLLQKIRTYAASSEKSPGQHEFFNEAELWDAAEEMLVAGEDEACSVASSAKTPSKKPSRKPLPTELPRIRIEHDLPEADKQCPCGCALTAIGEESSEQLDIIPAKVQVQVLVSVRKKYACKRCEEGVKTAPLPAQPIAKSNASPGFWQILSSPSARMPCPSNRCEATLERSGVELPRITLANLIILETGRLAWLTLFISCS